MNILYLLKTLDTVRLSEVMSTIDLPPLDANIAIWDAIDNNEIHVNEDKDRITAMKEAEMWHDPELASKIMRVVEQFTRNETNITRGRLYGYMKDPVNFKGYPVHEYLMTIQYLVDTGALVEHITSVPELKKSNGDIQRPYHKFVFLCLPDNDNEEWNAKAINKWMKNFEKSKKK